MSSYTMTTTTNLPVADAVAAVPEALEDQGFGVLTEIDHKASLKDSLNVDVEPQVIWGACRPSLAYEAIQIEPWIAAVLPCNVGVRAMDQDTTLVEAFDPDTMVGLVDSAAVGGSRLTPSSV